MTPSRPGTNAVLSALPANEHRRISSGCERVALVRDAILSQPQAPVHHVYFPMSGFILLIACAASTEAIGVGLIGSKSVLGASLGPGPHHSTLQTQVLGAGEAMRMSAGDFRGALLDCPVLQSSIQRHLDLQFSELARHAACAVYHVIERRLAYWLVLLQDQAPGAPIHLTHERLARVLGVRRSGLSTAAGELQRRGMIHYSRGQIVILNRSALRSAACRCGGVEQVS